MLNYIKTKMIVLNCVTRIPVENTKIKYFSHKLDLH